MQEAPRNPIRKYARSCAASPAISMVARTSWSIITSSVKQHGYELPAEYSGCLRGDPEPGRQRPTIWERYFDFQDRNEKRISSYLFVLKRETTLLDVRRFGALTRQHGFAAWAEFPVIRSSDDVLAGFSLTHTWQLGRWSHLARLSEPGRARQYTPCECTGPDRAGALV